jgi:hypothetical protein
MYRIQRLISAIVLISYSGMSPSHLHYAPLCISYFFCIALAFASSVILLKYSLGNTPFRSWPSLKKNTLPFGKSWIVNSILKSYTFYCNIMDFDERTSFPLIDAPEKKE